MNSTKPQRPKKRKPLIVKIFLTIAAIPVALLMVMVFEFLFQSQSAWDFIPKQFQAYLQVPSISKVYDDWSKLDALNIAFKENPSLAGLEKTLLGLRASGLNDSPLFRSLIDVQAHVVITKKNETMLVLDLGWRSALTRQLPMLGDLISMEGLSQIRKNGRTYFQYEWAKGSTAYILFDDNLAILSFKLETIEMALGLHQQGLSLSNIEKTRINQEFAKTDAGSLRFLVDPDSLVHTFISDSNQLSLLTKNITWSDSALVSLDLNNDSFSLKAATVLEAKNDLFKGLLGHKNDVLNSLRTIPASTYFYTSASLGDFEQLLKAWSALSGQNLEPTLNTVNSGALTLLGMSVAELLWSWVGDEAGMLYLGANGDPVFHVKVKDEGKRQQVFKKLSESVLVNIERNLVLDNVPIERIVIPDFVKGVLGIFNISFDTPYFIVLNDELFLSMNPENLARLTNEYRDGKLLYRTPEFERMTANSAKNPAVFLYYDLDKSTPFFLREPNLLSKVLKLYNRGTLSLFINDGYFSLDIGAVRVDQRKAQPFPGFPLAIKGGINSPPWVGFLPGRSDPLIAAVQQGNELFLNALAGNERIMNTPVENGSRLLPFIWDNEVLAWGPSGNFYRFNNKGEAIAPFPLLSPGQGSFPPVAFGDKFLAFDPKEGQLFTVARDGAITKLGQKFDAPIISPPDIQGNVAVMAPKTFEGSVFVIDQTGTTAKGWPQEGGGISLSGPKFLEMPDGQQIAFLTQNGNLNLWSKEGEAVMGFPVKLEGVFSAPPVSLHVDNQLALAALDQNGTLTFVKLDGTIIRFQNVSPSNPDARLAIHDIDGDGSDEIFIYGGKNTLDGFDSHFENLPGFPLKGSYQPQFLDLNLDGKTELIIGSYDGNIYAYSLRK